MERDMVIPATASRRSPLKPFLTPYRRRSQSRYYKNSGDYSIFSPKGSSTSMTPASSVSLDDDDADFATENRLYLAGLRPQYQDFANRYELCLSHLQDAACQAEVLRLENARLRIANGELRKRVSGRIFPSSSSNDAAAAAAISIADEFRKIQIENSQPAVESPTSVLGTKVAMPKSISVRSTGYKKINSDGGLNRNGHARVSKPVIVESQRVYVGGGNEDKRESDAEAAAAVAGLELEVYNQGMFKTELCNKWQETGACPYGDQCQFAHGIGELRPVIRHPRYKTEVCRMVLAGDTCPYGHRCHFRHALSSSDRRRRLFRLPPPRV